MILKIKYFRFLISLRRITVNTVVNRIMLVCALVSSFAVNYAIVDDAPKKLVLLGLAEFFIFMGMYFLSMYEKKSRKTREIDLVGYFAIFFGLYLFVEAMFAAVVS